MEEKRLAEIQLAQSTQKASMLEIQLNTQRAGKTHLAEQLHSVMQKQWQQALQIISGNNGYTYNFFTFALNNVRYVHFRPKV